MAFLAVVLNFFLVQKLIFGLFWNCKKWSLVKIKFREIYLFEFLCFFGLDFIKRIWPPVCIIWFFFNFRQMTNLLLHFTGVFNSFSKILNDLLKEAGRLLSMFWSFLEVPRSIVCSMKDSHMRSCGWNLMKKS